MKANTGCKELACKVQLLRIRVAAAQMEFKYIQEQARQAKCRHKEAKRISRRARKHCKRSKRELEELTQDLRKAELKLRRAGGSVADVKAAGIDRKPALGGRGAVSTTAAAAIQRMTRKRSVIRRSAVLSDDAIQDVSPDLESSQSQTL